MLSGECAGDIIDIAIHDLRDFIEREIDVMIGYAPLREIVGAYALGTIAAAHQ